MKEQLPDALSSFKQLIKVEDEQLLQRRKKLFGTGEDKEHFQKTRFGIALSGGGIRSATINLGFLKTLNKFGILQRSDYLSTVSGGGYTGAYIQATLRNEGSYSSLFKDEHINYMRSRGEYLLPGKGWGKRWSSLILSVGFVVSLLMSWVSPAIIILLLYLLYVVVSKALNFESFESVSAALEQVTIIEYGFLVLLGVLVIHFIANLALKYQVGISRKFNNLEAALILAGAAWMGVVIFFRLKEQEITQSFTIWHHLLLGAGLIILGFFTNPNALSFHRFYRNQLADAFLHFTGQYKNVRLKDLFDPSGTVREACLAPYPLINTCLNLQAVNDKKFKGTKANDYFLLSPLYCGSKLSDYVCTASANEYKEMTLPAATTISAAAVNPGMGIYSNKLLSVFMTVFNARLGFWINNPLQKKASSLVWWPTYFFYELLSMIGTDNRKLNISDGGHIENLGVYELLRRKCRLIIAVDAGADPKYSFGDLENLTIRARNELGLEIGFRPGYRPDETIRPSPSHGYSAKRFALADVYYLWEEVVPKEDGQPIKDAKGKPIEILINYKKIREKLEWLSEEERKLLKEALQKMKLQNFANEAVATLEDELKLQNTFEALHLSDSVSEVFKTLIWVFDDVKRMIHQKLEGSENRTDKEKKVLATVVRTIDEKVQNDLKMGTMVYVKSSVVAPETKLLIDNKNSLDYKTYKYKVYHPNFPHEPTSDQFFDEVQWESYYRLGQFIGAEVLGIRNLKDFLEGKVHAPHFNVEDLLAHFDKDRDLFASPDKVRMEPVPESAEEVAAPEVPVPPLETEATETAPPQEQVQEQEQAPVKKIVVGGEENYTI